MVFFGFCPDLAPVLTFVVGVARTDRFKHVLSRVLLGLALLGPIAFKILDESLGVVAKVAKVYSTATRFE